MTDSTTTLDDFIDEETDSVEVDLLQTNMTAIASADTGELDATSSAIGSLIAHGDAYVTTSMIGSLDGVTVNVQRSVAGAVIADANATVSKSLAPAIVTRHAEVSNSASAVTVATELSATNSWIGLMAARNATLSEDSRVIIDWKAALILGLCLLGGFGILAAIAWFAARRVIGALSELRETLHIPDISTLAHLPHVPGWVGKVVSMRHAA